MNKFIQVSQLDANLNTRVVYLNSSHIIRFMASDLDHTQTQVNTIDGVVYTIDGVVYIQESVEWLANQLKV